MRLPVKAHHLSQYLLMYTYVRSPVHSHIHDTMPVAEHLCTIVPVDTRVHVHPFNTHTQMNKWSK